MSNLRDITDQPLLRVWEGVAARTVEGERLSLALVELDPDAVVPEHHHPHEQLGMVIRGTVSFRIGAEERTFGPGGTWRVPVDAPHEVHAGPEGAQVIDIFAPVREDWHELPELAARPPRWP